MASEVRMSTGEIGIIQEATERKLDELLRQRAFATEQIEHFSKKLENVTKEIDDCYAVARLFQFDLPASSPMLMNHSETAGTGIRNRKVYEDATIRDFVKEYLQKIY